MMVSMHLQKRQLHEVSSYIFIHMFASGHRDVLLTSNVLIIAIFVLALSKSLFRHIAFSRAELAPLVRHYWE